MGSPYSRRREVQAVTVNRGGSISLSVGFGEKYSVGTFRFVKLYADRVGRQIAFRLTNVRSPGVAKLSAKKTGYCQISAISFFKWCAVDPDSYAQQYRPTKRLCRSLGIDEPGYCFVFDLKAIEHEHGAAKQVAQLSVGRQKVAAQSELDGQS
jgi:hypothetical protein